MVAEKDRIYFSTFGITVATIGVILNAIGTYSLKVTGRTNSRRQTYFLIDISILSIVMCCQFIPLWLLWCFISHKSLEIILFTMQTGFYMAYATSSIGLTLDRFLSVAMPLKHRAFVSLKIVRIYIVCCWLVSLLSRIPFLCLSSSYLMHLVRFDIAVDTINLVFQPATFVYVIFKLKASFGAVRNQSPSASPFTIRRASIAQRNAAKELRLLKISLLIGVCCVIASTSNVLYSIAGMTIASSNDSILSPIALVLWNLPVTVQPLIYIIMKPEIRSHLKQKLCSCMMA